jgi:hypothetical protein
MVCGNIHLPLFRLPILDWKNWWNTWPRYGISLVMKFPCLPIILVISGLNSCIRLGNAVEKYQLAWLEDMIPWFYTDQWRQLTEAINTPTLTGEDIYLKEEFIKLIDAKAVDMVHPDLASAGGILETKKIGDYAEEHGIAMAFILPAHPSP